VATASCTTTAAGILQGRSAFFRRLVSKNQKDQPGPCLGVEARIFSCANSWAAFKNKHHTNIQTNIGRVMQLNKIFLVIMLVTGTVSVANAEQYEPTNYSTGTICDEFLRTVKSSGIVGMNKQKLCELRNSPDGVIFAGQEMTNLSWTPYMAQDKFQLAKSLFENSMRKSELSRFSKTEELYLREIQVLISKDKLRVIRAPIEIDGQKILAIMLQTSRCDGGEEDDWMPVFNFVKAPGSEKELVISVGGQRAGQLVYVEGKPASLNVAPFWGPPNAPHPILIVNLMSLHYGNDSIFDWNMCEINIVK
jgi:hypothetical protein